MESTPKQAENAVTKAITAENISEFYDLSSIVDVSYLHRDSFKREPYYTTLPLDAKSKIVINEIFGKWELKKTQIDNALKGFKDFIVKHLDSCEEDKIVGNSDMSVIKSIDEQYYGSKMSLAELAIEYTEHLEENLSNEEDEKNFIDDADIRDNTVGYFVKLPMYNKDAHGIIKAKATQLKEKGVVEYKYNDVAHVILAGKATGVYCTITGEMVALYNSNNSIDNAGSVVRDITPYIIQ